jgi:AhpD family alkylhydroperoxidase
MADQSIDDFRARRAEGQARLLDTDHLGLKRFMRLDTDAYTDRSDEGRLDARTKELLGLVASTVLRCDDCITYHIEKSVEQGWSKREIEDALNVALVVGGSITIPHLRRARTVLDALSSDSTK